MKYTHYLWLTFVPSLYNTRHSTKKENVKIVFTCGQASKTNMKLPLCCGSRQVRKINKRRPCTWVVHQLHPVLSFRCEIQFTERAYVVNIRLQFKWRLVLISAFHWNADLQLLQPWGWETGELQRREKEQSRRKKKKRRKWRNFIEAAGL